jgi:uncharacterized protein (TIGR02646 family)
MLKLSINVLSAQALRHLAAKQLIIDNLVISKQVGQAQNLWDAKTRSKAGSNAFAEVKQVLVSMCVSTELCNYCEQNEATDIEHIYPKSFFPERTFHWTNYLLSCKTCNTHYKLDQFAVFTPPQSNTAVFLQRKQLPTSVDAAFIDPRVEEPMQYLFLDIQGKTFHLIPHPSLTDLRDIAKATHTLEVLQIGQRAALSRSREHAFKYYQGQLERYKNVRDATSLDSLEALVQDPNLVDRSNTFELEQQTMLIGIKQNILEHLHPTVWREMQRQYQSLKRTKELFESVPEALTWV